MGLLDGKKGLILNVANDRSIAWHIGHNAIQTYGATYTQTLLDGYGTASRTRQAEQLVSAARETLRLTEQTSITVENQHDRHRIGAREMLGLAHAANAHVAAP